MLGKTVLGKTVLGKAVWFALMLILTGCVSSTLRNTPSGKEITEKTANLSEAATKRLTLGLKYLENGNLERAKFNLDRATQHAPNSHEVMVGMAYYYEQVKEFALARKFYQSSLSVSPNNGDNLNSYASFLCNQEEYEEANKLFMKAINLPEYSGAGSSYENAGICASRAGDRESAEAYFKKALNYNTGSARTLLEMASLSFGSRDFLTSRAYLRQHLQLTTGSPRALWLGIQIERLLGDKDALSSYQIKLVGMYPQSAETKLYQKSLNK